MAFLGKGGHRVYINTFIYCRLEQDLSMSQNAYLHPGVATPQAHAAAGTYPLEVASHLPLQWIHVTLTRRAQSERSYPRLNT